MTPLLQFRLWWRRGNAGERMSAIIATAIVVGLAAWVLVPTTSSKSSTSTVQSGATNGAAATGATTSSSVAPGAGATGATGATSGGTTATGGNTAAPTGGGTTA